MINPFSLHIFVAVGDPDGLRIVDKSNWIAKALVVPRALLSVARIGVLVSQAPQETS